MRWLPMKERSEHIIARLAWKSINKIDWPKFIPMVKDDRNRQRPSRCGQIGGTTLLQTSNIAGSFEYEASKTFNELPVGCRNSLSYNDFCRQSKKYFLDKALARSLQ